MTFEQPSEQNAGSTLLSPWTPTQDWAFGLSVFGIGFIVNLCFARMGFMPLDASIVFDGGWRILSGQVPWRDFVTPYGLTPSVMQALFFAVAGRTWLAFCLHSSVVNGAFAVVLYLLLVVLRLPRPLAFFYALCSAFFFYAMIGVPFIDQHSFFFTLAAIAAAVAGNYAVTERIQWRLWFAVPWLVLLAILSKHVPVAFAAPVLLILVVLPAPTRLWTRVSGLATGMAASATASLFAILALRIPRDTLFEYLILRPREVGGMRTAGLSQLAQRVAARYDDLPSAMGLTFIENATVLYRASLAALPIVLGVYLITRKRTGAMSGDVSRATCALILAPAMYVISMLLGFVTNNQAQNSVAFYPVGAALLHAALCAEIRVFERGLGLVGAAETQPARRLWNRAILRHAAAGAVVVVSIAPVRHWTLDTVSWATRVDMTRMVNDMTFDFSLAARSEQSLPHGMEFIRWTPSPATYDLAGWTDLTAFLGERAGNILIIGDTLVTYGLLGRPSIAPNLWFHPGLAMPAPSDAEFAAYEDALLDRIAKFDVRYIVIEGDQTRLGFSVDQLPRLSVMLESRWSVTHTFGPNRVYEPAPH